MTPKIKHKIAVALRKDFLELDADEVDLLWKYTFGATMEELLLMFPLDSNTGL